MSEVDVLQQCLRAEHAACYGYGVLGGVLGGLSSGGADDQRARTSYEGHRRLRDELTAMIVTGGVDPAAAEPAYATPFEIRSSESCRRLARVLEDRCSVVYAYAVSQTAQEPRQFALDALTECAVRAVEWGSAAAAFPGLDDSAT
jgi:Domain of unknown function (DUF4439)